MKINVSLLTAAKHRQYSFRRTVGGYVQRDSRHPLRRKCNKGIQTVATASCHNDLPASTYIQFGDFISNARRRAGDYDLFHYNNYFLR
jgi:hypothetical protein